MINTLEFDNVSKTFNKKGKQIKALKNISFSIKEGEVFGFIGPNGAGKSTTIKVILDIINDYEGEVRIYGTPSHDAKARQSIAYLPESPALYEQFTPIEIIKMALRAYGSKRSNDNDWCMKWLDRFSVGHNANRRIRHLSKGNVQRVALAHALVVEPRLLILDEPLSGLDPVGRKDVVEILQEYKNNGGSIFFTSHVLHDVERLADRFGFINEGKLVALKQPHELSSDDNSSFIVRYHSSNNLFSTGVVIREDEFEHKVTQNELPDFISKITKHNGKVITITPAVSLETTFFQILNGNN